MRKSFWALWLMGLGACGSVGRGDASFVWQLQDQNGNVVTCVGGETVSATIDNVTTIWDCSADQGISGEIIEGDYTAHLSLLDPNGNTEDEVNIGVGIDRNATTDVPPFVFEVQNSR